MDKSGVRILVGCIFSTLLIVILFMLAYQFTQPSCELILVEPEAFDDFTAREWTDSKPLSAHDKSLLLRMAGYLEYHQPGEQPESREPLTSNDNNHSQDALPASSALVGSAAGSGVPRPNSPHPTPPQAGQQNQTQKGLIQLHIEKSLQVGQTNSTLPLVQKQQPVTNLTQPPNVDLNQPATSNQSTIGSTVRPNTLSQKARFLPITLNDLELSRNIEDTKAKYVLNFNCSHIELVFVRRLEKVYVESIKIELKLMNRHKSKCEIRLPNNMAFATEVDAASGMARYKCIRPQQFDCLDKNQENLVTLHIQAIEWETGNTIGNSTHQIGYFVSPYKTCEPVSPIVSLNPQPLPGAIQVAPATNLNHP